MHRFKLLFPAQIGAQVDHIAQLWHDFTMLRAACEDSNKDSREWSDHDRKCREVWEEIEARNQNLRKNIEDFIRVDWNG